MKRFSLPDPMRDGVRSGYARRLGYESSARSVDLKGLVKRDASHTRSLQEDSRVRLLSLPWDVSFRPTEHQVVREGAVSGRKEEGAVQDRSGQGEGPGDRSSNFDDLTYNTVGPAGLRKLSTVMLDSMVPLRRTFKEKVGDGKRR
jgi:hypothetical protein